MSFKILNTIGDKYSQKGKEILDQLGEVDYLEIDREKFLEGIDKYDVVFVGLGLNIDKEIIDKAENLKFIVTATTGLDHIDIEYAKEKNIEVLSLKNETEFLNTITGTAELAFGLIIDLLRLLPWSFDDVKNYHWNRENFRGYNLAGKTLGIVGVGRLGKIMIQYGKAFNMNIIAYDPEVENIDCEKVSFDELIEKSDVISIHVHLNKKTENMFNLSVFEKMKNSAFLINTSRGKIVNEENILNALKNKNIAGYGTDVLANEIEFNENFNNHPLVEYAKENKNLIIVPHIGGMTYESREMTDIFMAEKLKKNLI